MAKPNLLLLFITLFFQIATSVFGQEIEWYTPINLSDRMDFDAIELTNIGSFGLKRIARPGIPAHLHTGIDIKRPGKNYFDEPVFPIAMGTVASVRSDGPFAQIIIEHIITDSLKIWTVYEHVSGIIVDVGQFVEPGKQIARFMNKDELNNYGWQFDHIHFEILKKQPVKMNASREHPQRFFRTYSLVCYSKELLEKYYYSPLDFFKPTNSL